MSCSQLTAASAAEPLQDQIVPWREMYKQRFSAISSGQYVNCIYVVCFNQQKRGLVL